MTDDTASAPPAGPMTPEACAQELKARFPKLFTGAPKPVKLKVQADIQQRAPGVFSKAALSAFFRRYTGSHSYLLALTKATNRFNLDGEPDGELAEEHRQAAREELERRRGAQNERRALEDQQRRNRGQLLWDFEHTTLTASNFCALKGLPVEELEGLLAMAREERAQAPAPEMHARHDRFERPRPGGDRTGPRGDRGDRGDRPAGDRPRGDRPSGQGPARGPGGGGDARGAGPRGPQDGPRGPRGPRPPGGGPGRPGGGAPHGPGGRPPRGPKPVTATPSGPADQAASAPPPVAPDVSSTPVVPSTPASDTTSNE
jgi:hypothetical protein